MRYFRTRHNNWFILFTHGVGSMYTNKGEFICTVSTPFTVEEVIRESKEFSENEYYKRVKKANKL